MKTMLILMMVLCNLAIYAQTNRSGNPINPTQPDPNRPNTTVTPNQQIPVITNVPVQSPGSVVNPQGTVSPGGQVAPLVKTIPNPAQSTATPIPTNT